MPTLNSPILAADAEAPLGHSFAFLGNAVLQELAEQADLLSGPLFSFVGDVAGSGSDTVRLRRYGGIGAALGMTAMGSETAAIVPSGFTANTNDLTIARYGLGFSESFQRAGIAGDGITLEFLAGTILQSYQRPTLTLAHAHGATFATNKADATATLDVDDWLNLAAGFTETEGYDPAVHGLPQVMLHNVQLTQLKASLRSETALQFPEPFDTYQGVQPQAGFAFELAGMNAYTSTHVDSSGGDYAGYAVLPGGLIWAIMSTGTIPVTPGTEVVRVPELGLIVTRSTTGGQALNAVEGNAFIGVGSRDAAVQPKFLFKSNQT